MQTITQSVVESYTKLVYKYIKQDVEAENNHTAKGKQSDMYIELKDINKTFGNYKASDHVEFGIEKGKLVALLEPSGSGKTTILRMIAGLEHQDSGDIYIDGTCVNELLVRERGIGFVFQNYALFLMWFGVGEKSKVALIFYAVIFPVMVNTIAGVRTVDDALIEASESLGADGVKTFFTVIIPSAVPNIFTGVRLGLSGAIICIVAAEMLAASEGIGYLIYTSRLYYKTDWIFIGIFTLGIIGFLADRILQFVGRKALKRFGVR